LNLGLYSCEAGAVLLEPHFKPHRPPTFFFSAYFGDQVLLLAQASLDHHPPILSFLLLLG
jgi:hypothetical protein